MPQSLWFVAAALVGATFCPTADAEPYPNHAITLVVPYVAGGGTDALARSLARSLSTRWNVPVIVENVAGADGFVGSQRVLRSPADGYTLLLQINSMLLWKWTQPEFKVDVLQQFTLVSMIERSPQSVVVSGTFPGTTIKDLVSWCKMNPCNYASATRYAELVGRQVMDLAGLKDAVSISYKGTAPMITDLIGGTTVMALPAVSAALHYVKSGTLKFLAVGGSRRFKSLPDVPTLIESGYPVVGEVWYGVMVAKGTPAPIVTTISDGLKSASNDPNVLKLIDDGGGEPVFGSADQFASAVKQESAQLEELAGKFPLLKN